jgi:pyruvate dehydrogenase E1 component beta subunit
VGAEIAARVQEVCFDRLEAPVLRVAFRDVPMPYATNLEKLVVVSPERIIDAVKKVKGY